MFSQTQHVGIYDTWTFDLFLMHFLSLLSFIIGERLQLRSVLRDAQSQ